MRWTSWWPGAHPRRLSVVGLDIASEGCSLVVLSGSPTAPDSVCCSDRLALPAGWVEEGEVLQSAALGHWLRSYLDAGDYQPQVAYVGVDGAWISHHWVTLAAGLSPDDVSFQLLAEVQATLPEPANDVCIDYTLDTEPAPEGEQRYRVQATRRSQVEVLQRVVELAGLKLAALEPRHDAARRSAVNGALSTLPPASLALALQCNEAFGLALHAWDETGFNFLPHREDAQHALHRAWWLGVAVSAMGGAFLAAGFAMVMASAADSKQPHRHVMTASTRAFDEAHKTYAQAQLQQDRWTEQARWLKTRQDLQAQTLRWSQVLSQSTQGVWVASVKQQGARWMVQGEALSAGHAQQLVVQLKALDVWVQAPELPHLQVLPASARTGVLVWQFRIEAELKVGA